MGQAAEVPAYRVRGMRPMKNKPIAMVHNCPYCLKPIAEAGEGTCWGVHNCLYCLKPIAEAGEGTCWGCLPYTLKGIILRTEVGYETA